MVERNPLTGAVVRWRIKGGSHSENYETEGEAIAAAWEITPPGEQRPEVRAFDDTRYPPADPGPVDVRTFQGTMIEERMSVEKRVFDTATQMDIQRELMHRLMSTAERRNLEFDRAQVDIESFDDPARFAVKVVARVLAWRKEDLAIIGSIPILARGRNEVCVSIAPQRWALGMDQMETNQIALLREERLGWQILGTTSEGFTFNTSTSLT
jgi:hypothetical protein